MSARTANKRGFFAITRVLGLSVGEDFVIIAGVVLTQCQGVTLQTHGRTHGGTDGPTDRRTIRSNTELYISSYADAL